MPTYGSPGGLRLRKRATSITEIAMPLTLPRRALLGAELPGDEVAFTADGIWVTGVAPGSMAEIAGMASGDQLRSVAGRRVRSLAELGVALREAARAGAAVELVYARGDTQISSTVDVIGQPFEQIEGAMLHYGAIDVGGVRLRTIEARVGSPRALVAFVQGIACESIDHAMSPDAPLAGLVVGWAGSRYESIRFDKRGVGDSDGGPCPATDFATEVADAHAVLTHARDLARTRGIPLVVCGHSVGGIIAALLAPALEPDGVIVYGTPVMRWIDCLKDSTKRQLLLRNAPADDIASRCAALDKLASRGELNGRSAAYHRQLDEIDLETAWRSVRCPVLVVRGEHDWVVDADDQARIASLAAGPTTIADLPALDHLFGAHADREASLRDYGIGAFDSSIVSATVDWLDQLRSPA